MIKLKGIHKQFGGNKVLQGVDLEIEQGETHVILGRSGTGKSVALKIICGLLPADQGEVWIGGQRLEPGRPASLALARSQIQMLFQGAALFDSMDVAHNVAFHALEHGAIAAGEAGEFARPYLEMVDLAQAGDLMPSELSGGMKKRVALARALAAKPKIMLYDEPTTGLDPLTCRVINELIRETQRRFGVTSLVVTHDLRSAQDVGDRCSFFHEGQVLETSQPLHLGESAHPIVRAFLDNARVSG